MSPRRVFLSVLLVMATIAAPAAGQDPGAVLRPLETRTLALAESESGSVGLPGYVGIAEDAVGGVQIALAISQATFTTADRVLIARDDVFADALASGVLQGGPAPLLLVPSAGPVPDAVMAHVAELGATEARVLGGETAVAPAVATQLEDAGLAVQRIAGPDRITTAVRVAETAATSSTTAIVARAFAGPGGDGTQAWADSVAAGGWAAEQGYPILLTGTDALAEATRTHLVDGGYERVVIAGGTAAVSDAVLGELEALDLEVTRVAGPNRFETSVAIGRARDAEVGPGVPLLISGVAADDWTAGLPAASLAGARGLRTILIAPGAAQPDAVLAYIAELLTVGEPASGSRRTSADASPVGFRQLRGPTPTGGTPTRTVTVGDGDVDGGIADVISQAINIGEIILGSITAPSTPARFVVEDGRRRPFLSADRVSPGTSAVGLFTDELDSTLIDSAGSAAATIEFLAEGPEGRTAERCAEETLQVDESDGEAVLTVDLRDLSCDIDRFGELSVSLDDVSSPLATTFRFRTQPRMQLAVVGAHDGGTAPVYVVQDVDGDPLLVISDLAAAEVDVRPGGDLIIAVDDRGGSAEIARSYDDGLEGQIVRDDAGDPVLDETGAWVQRARFAFIDHVTLETSTGPDDTFTSPSVSPDGSTVAFSASSFGAGPQEVRTISTFSGDPVTLESTFGFINDQAWSVVDSSPDEPVVTWWSGGEPGSIVRAPSSGAGDPVTLASGGFRPAVAPDGRIVDVDGIGGSDLILIDPQGSASTLSPEGVLQMTSPTWNPDGTRFAVVRQVTGGDWEVAVHDTDGTLIDSTPLADDDVPFNRVVNSPEWGPDGIIAIPAADQLALYAVTDDVLFYRSGITIPGGAVDVGWAPPAP